MLLKYINMIAYKLGENIKYQSQVTSWEKEKNIYTPPLSRAQW